MQSNLNKIILTAFVLVILGSATEAIACMCGKASTCERFNWSDAIFVGKAVRVEKDDTGTFKKEFTIFEVQEVFSGKKSDTIRIQNRSGIGCDTSFELGETYLVFAAGYDSGGFGTGFCSGNLSIEDAANEITSLRKLSGAKGDGKLRGLVQKETSKSRDDRFPLSDIRIEISEIDSGRKFEVMSKDDGRFELSAPPGRYKIKPIVPQGYIMSGVFDSEEATQIRSGGCTESYFVFSNNSRVTGRIFDSEGKPVRYARVELVSVADQKIRYLAGLSDESDPNGDFTIDQIPIGKYTLSINYNSKPEPDSPFPTTFYPSGSNRSDAKVLNVEFGTSIDGLKWRLPERLTEASISGSVVMEDGSAVSGAEIKIFDTAFPGHYAGCGLREVRTTADPSKSPVASTSFKITGPACDLKSSADGRFNLKMYAQRAYRVTARLERTISGKKVEYTAESEPFQLTASIGIRLVLTKAKETK
jgi:hypothetical protein